MFNSLNTGVRVCQRLCDGDGRVVVHRDVLFGYPVGAVLEVVKRHFGVACVDSILDGSGGGVLSVGITPACGFFRNGVHFAQAPVFKRRQPGNTRQRIAFESFARRVVNAPQYFFGCADVAGGQG